jgi:hypothetical protein
MPQKPPPPPAPPPPSDGSGYGEAKRRPPERVTFPGIPERHRLRLPPGPPEVPADAVPRPRAQTLPGSPAPPAGGLLVASLPPPPNVRGDRTATMPEPPRSMTPSPVSVSGDGVRFRWVALRRALPWILTLVGISGGGVTGYFAAWKAQLAEVAGMKRDAQDAKKRLGALEAGDRRQDERLDGHDAALTAEAQSNRTERATRDLRHKAVVDDLEVLKKTFKIEGLPKK